MRAAESLEHPSEMQTASTSNAVNPSEVHKAIKNSGHMNHKELRKQFQKAHSVPEELSNPLWLPSNLIPPVTHLQAKQVLKINWF